MGLLLSASLLCYVKLHKYRKKNLFYISFQNDAAKKAKHVDFLLFLFQRYSLLLGIIFLNSLFFLANVIAQLNLQDDFL